MKHIIISLNWIFGSAFLLIGLIFLINVSYVSLSLILISLFLLPPIREKVYSKTQKELSTKTRTIAISILLFTALATNSFESKLNAQALAIKEAKDQMERESNIRMKNIEFYNSNRKEIILSINKHLIAKEYFVVVEKSAKYLVAGDNELNELHNTAKTKLLLNELKAIPKKEAKKNKDLYQQLVTLNPGSETYKRKLSYYSKKIEEAFQKKIAAKNRAEQIKKQFSAWDGSHIKLERFIKEAMNDPDSYEHDETVYWDKGSYLVVQITFRGKNAFGGVVRNFIKAKVSLNGEILDIIDQS